MKVTQITWNEPNRANTPPLHIASRGERFSTLTGVWWIDAFRFVVNHRSGLMLAVFDIRTPHQPMAISAIPHLTDDIAAKKIDDNLWEIAVSGCWDAAYSIYQLRLGNKSEFKLMSTQAHKDRTFCHGVAYDNTGNLCLTFHTGTNPRIQIADKTWVIPKPWGVRDICYDEMTQSYYAIAVSENPQRSSYLKTSTSIWKYLAESDAWQMINIIDDMHSDACQIYQGRIWLPDQKGDRVLGICLNKEKPQLNIKGSCFDFPHGLGISERGMLAVTNYGSSSITLIDISQQ